MKKTLQTAVMGVTGYAGMELARLLLRHPQLKNVPPVFLGRAETAANAASLTELHPQLMDNNGSHALKIEPFSWELLKERGVEVLFLATPHEQSR
jgi:N-acetyl-gamma-glutamyl-phosphate reductase